MPMMLRLPFLTGLCLGLLVSCDRQPAADGKADAVSPETAALPEKVTFNAHIRPIFSDTCFACHGFDAKTRKEDLRLDTPEGAYAKLKDSDLHAIVPGKPNESAILDPHLLERSRRDHAAAGFPQNPDGPPESTRPPLDRTRGAIREALVVHAHHQSTASETRASMPARRKTR